ncbi:hypothetical protein KQR54_14000 [Mycobacterium gordonae]|jgi:hypothetical protein|nr:hypothetical protein [Mycobacterium gordonae]MBI2701149.1 hypothetical protein [Mycobacterium sp.]MBX9978838.1 hypothetical protein [Mycobacterium gordonae]MCQ4362237.1 hypothetical protein [Mycobacterium gordonae]
MTTGNRRRTVRVLGAALAVLVGMTLAGCAIDMGQNSNLRAAAVASAC